MEKAGIEALELLKKLIETPSASTAEADASKLIMADVVRHGYVPDCIGLNILVRGKNNREGRPTLLLNSHMDTVKPVDGWKHDPFKPVIEDRCLYGLGSNDAGGSLVSLLYTFYLLDAKGQDYNLLFLATAEEEKNGVGGMKMAVKYMKDKYDIALIGEPTGMQPAIAEKGLMVLDFTARGKAGHAARNEGINAIYRAMEVIKMLQEFPFPEQTDLLGPVKLTVTMINAGTQHNVIPNTCTFTADVRSNECYSNQEIFSLIRNELPDWCDVTARSTNLNSSRIDINSPLIQRATAMGLKPYGSPTLSDQAILSCPSFKMGPGESARSHTADEYIRLDELENAIPTYMQLLDGASIR